MMADDLGYGDTGFNGNTIIKTPNLDKLAQDGAHLKHFYSVGPVCSPTRGSCLTGRHYYRFGIYTANAGNLPKQEITMARMLKSKGYTTGHFGKWHLGTLSKTMSSKGEKRKPAINYSPPWERDYDRSFVTESAVTTWNPGIGPRAVNNPFYDDGVPVDGEDSSLRGGAARVVVDRAIPFIEKAVDEEKPFLAVVWFHAPHENIEAGPEYLAMYPEHGDGAHFYGCITELDEQVGRIRSKLDELGIADNTLIFFCSDNGPEGKEAKGRRMGVTNGLRGRKRSVYDGGVRVPAIAAFPGHIKPGTVIDSPLCTLDYFPTVARLAGFEMPDDRPIDGENIMPILMGKKEHRSKSIPFRFNEFATLVKGTHKLVLPAGELYDLSKDWSEAKDLATQYPEIVGSMKKELLQFLDSFEDSHAGVDYNDPTFKPTDKWRPFKLKKN
jgi:arylsulfatase A-like enzyme